jgi:hypothetical protein
MTRGCNPCASACRFSIGGMCAHTVRRTSLGRLPSHHSSHWPSSSRCGCATALLHSACSSVVATAL